MQNSREDNESGKAGNMDRDKIGNRRTTTGSSEEPQNGFGLALLTDLDKCLDLDLSSKK